MGEYRIHRERGGGDGRTERGLGEQSHKQIKQQPEGRRCRLRLASEGRKRQVGTVDLGEQEAVATQTSPEENDQLIGAWAQQKAEPIFGRPEIERARACAHAVRCVIPASEVVDITTNPSPTTPVPTALQCSQAADAHALQGTRLRFRLTSISLAQCLECIDEDTPPSTTKLPPRRHTSHTPRHVCAREDIRAPSQGGNTTCQSQASITMPTGYHNMPASEDNITPVVCGDKQDNASEALLCECITTHGHPR